MDHPDWKEDAKRVSEGLRPLHAQIPDESLARAKRDKVRDPKLPEPYDFWPVDYSVKKSLRERFKKEGLQVIVKMASVELTPEKPEFPAGGWHVSISLFSSRGLVKDVWTKSMPTHRMLTVFHRLKD